MRGEPGPLDVPAGQRGLGKLSWGGGMGTDSGGRGTLCMVLQEPP